VPQPDDAALSRDSRAVIAAYLSNQELGHTTWRTLGDELGLTYGSNALIGLGAIAASLAMNWRDNTGNPTPWLWEQAREVLARALSTEELDLLDQCIELTEALVARDIPTVQAVAGTLGLVHGPAAIGPMAGLSYWVCVDVAQREGVTPIEFFQEFSLANEQHETNPDA